MPHPESSLGLLCTHGKEKSSIHGLAKTGGCENGAAGVILLPNEKNLCENSQAG